MSADPVELWLIPTRPGAPARLARLTALLDRGERERAAGMRFDQDRERFVVAHGVARLIIGNWLGAPPDRLRWSVGPHGKPELDGVRASLSHAGDLTALAVTRHRSIGVDIERRQPGVDVTRMAARFYPPPEADYVRAASDPAERGRRFVRLWTRKEALVKVAGGRLVPGLALAVAQAGPVPGLGGPCLVRDLPDPPGCLAAVALAGTAPYQVTQHWWGE